MDNLNAKKYTGYAYIYDMQIYIYEIFKIEDSLMIFEGRERREGGGETNPYSFGTCQ